MPYVSWNKLLESLTKQMYKNKLFNKCKILTISEAQHYELAIFMYEFDKELLPQIHTVLTNVILDSVMP